MGKGQFKEGTLQIPYKAKTGEKVTCSIVCTNTDWEPLTYVHCKGVWVLASDPEGKNVVAQGEVEFDLWTYADVTLSATFTMPNFDVYVGALLYQWIGDHWVLVDSTIMIPIDNPDYPPWWSFWELTLFGLKVYQWMIIGLGVTLAGVMIGVAARR
jgi:hypothetical protein